MKRIRSRIASALGGAVWVRGGGLIALVAVGLLAGVGCTGSRALRMQDVLPASWVQSEPATQIVCAFNPQVQHLPDPSKDGVLGAGLIGQLYLIAAGGKFTDATGDLYVMAEDITVRPPGQMPAVSEIWHFDAATLRKLRTKDERFGDCYALFLPYPPNWKDVTQLRINTQYKTKGEAGKEQTLPGPPQTLLLDFTPPGEQPSVWLKKDPDEKQTAPVQMKGMPNVSRDIARGGFGAPLSGPQPNGTVVAGGTQSPTGGSGVVPATGQSGPVMPAFNPFANPPAAGATPPPSNTPPLPPPMQFTPDHPQATVRGPNGETLNMTVMALPPGQSMPNGWAKQPDGSIQPPSVAAASQPQNQYQQPQSSQMQQMWPAQAGYSSPPSSGYQPASSNYVPASQRQSRIQHGAFNPPTQSVNTLQQQPVMNPQQPMMNPQQPVSVPPTTLPAIPSTAIPPARNSNLPPVGSVPGNVPPLPAMSGGFAGPATPMNLPQTTGIPPQTGVPPVNNFDPNSPVGAWANPTTPAVPPLPPGVGYNAQPVVPPGFQGMNEAPLVTQTISRQSGR